MIRSLAFFSFAAIVGAVLCAPLVMMQTGEIVVGGHYIVGPGETLDKDISFYFAQVRIDEGASVESHVFLYSSSLDLRGRVTEDIHAFESDLTVRETAQVDGEIDEKEFIHWTVLLPAAAKLP
jgi:hypothetical protein